MATTTNYGWTTPDDTALVKDGASAIRTLGTSVDTTTKNLNPQTTLGDIAYRSSTSNVNTRLGIGSTGQVLTVAGGVPSWATSSSGGMTLLSTTTLSGGSTNITGISQDYVNLYVLVTGVTNASADGGLRLIPNSATNNAITGKVTATQHNYAGIWGITFEQAMDRTSANNAFALNIFNYASTTTYKPISWSGYYVGTGAVDQYVTGGGGIYDNAAISNLFFYHGGGNFSAGTVKVYGVK